MSPVGRRNLARLAEEARERHGDYPAVSFDGEWLGSGELSSRAGRLAVGLSEHGVGPGDRVVVTMENSPDVLVVYDAVFRAGGVIVPAIFLLTADELRRIVTDSGAVAVVTSPALRQTVDAATAGHTKACGSSSRSVPSSKRSRRATPARSSPATTTTWPPWSTPAGRPAGPRA